MGPKFAAMKEKYAKEDEERKKAHEEEMKLTLDEKVDRFVALAYRNEEPIKPKAKKSSGSMKPVQNEMFFAHQKPIAPKPKV